MGLFGSLRKVAGAATGQVKAEYQGNKDFLEACCAAVALVAYADGELEAPEREKALKIVGQHATLSKIYNSNDIERTLETMLKRADSYAGRVSLLRELGDIKGKEPTSMAEDAYLIGLDVAFADGELEEKEVKVLKQISDLLNVDLKKLGLHDLAAA